MAITSNLMMPYNVDPTKTFGVTDPNDPTKKQTPDGAGTVASAPAAQPTPAVKQAPAIQTAPTQTFSQMQESGVARPPAPTTPNVNPVPAIATAQAPAAPSLTDPLPAGYVRDPLTGTVAFQNQGGAGAAPLTQPIAQKYWDNATQSYKDSIIPAAQTQAGSDALIAGQTGPSYQGSIADQNAAWEAKYGGTQMVPTYDANGNITGTTPYAGGTASGPGLEQIAQQNAINSAPSPQSLQATAGTAAAPTSGGATDGIVGTPSATAPGTSAPGTSAGGFDIQNFLTQGVQGQGPGSDVQSATNQAILNQLQNPNPYNSQTVQDAYKWLSGNIDDQYALQQKQLAEDAARRGLGASTIYAGNLNDLNIGKRSAQETLAQNLAQNLAQSQGQYQANAINQGLSGATNSQTSAQNWLSQLLGYGQQAFNNDLATNAQNQSAQQNWQNYVLQLLGLGYSPTG